MSSKGVGNLFFIVATVNAEKYQQLLPNGLLLPQHDIYTQMTTLFFNKMVLVALLLEVQWLSLLKKKLPLLTGHLQAQNLSQ